MKRAIIFIAICAAFMPAIAQNEQKIEQSSNQQSERSKWLPTTLGIHIASHHFTSASPAPGSLGWNDRNTGVFAGWDIGQSQPLGMRLKHQFIAGGFANSLFERSYYAGLDTTTERLHTPVGSFGLALSATLTSGYDRYQADYKGGAVPAGQRIRARCTPALGCRDVLTKPTLLFAIAPGIDYQPPFQSAPTLRLSYLHDAGVGSKAVHLTARWSF